MISKNRLFITQNAFDYSYVLYVIMILSVRQRMNFQTCLAGVFTPNTVRIQILLMFQLVKCFLDLTLSVIYILRLTKSLRR